ncbi:hypothetical protein [Actinokineospora enzanensis]|uniref:hypothetical protein n=1 Tax=Actinokineospora enzanensis TaxID=155975 RepID=UPI00036B2431|nr:hypothetical protein [Actinokineospora enzanensis]
MGLFGKGKGRARQEADRFGGGAIAIDAAAPGANRTAQQLLSSGVPATLARVEGVMDTGHAIEYDPVVDLVLRVDGYRHPVRLRTAVPRISVPRPGESVVLVADPARPGTLLYAGLSL